MNAYSVKLCLHWYLAALQTMWIVAWPMPGNRKGEYLASADVFCDTPDHVMNGEFTMTGWAHFDQIEITCDPGYQYTGQTPIYCLDGHWSAQLGQCIVDHGCGEVPVIDKAEVRVVGDKAEVECRSGYTLSGARILHCLYSGTWTTTRCIKICEGHPAVAHGKVTVVGRAVGDVANVTCDTTYRLEGAAQVTCEDEGTWTSAGRCLDILCGDLDIEQGNVTITGRRVGDVAEVTCHLGYQLEGASQATCQVDGTWSGQGVCTEVTSCPVMVIQDGQLTLRGGQSTGDVARVTCLPGYRLEGPDTITCLQGGHWSPPGNCTDLSTQTKRTRTAPRTLISLVTTGALLVAGVCLWIHIRKRRRAAHERAVERWRLMHDLEAESRTKVEALLIKNLKVTLGPRIGKGHFAMVYRGIYQGRKHANRPPIALKTLRGHPTSHGEKLTEFITEASLMKNFNHPNVLSLHGITIIRNRLYVVLPFLPNGDLKSFVVKTAFSMKLFTHLAYDVAKGMQYLAQQNFVHRDLAARNCMVDANNRAVVGDFGLTRDLYHRDYYSPSGLVRALPIKWMALETLEKNVYTLMSDFWAYGVLLWEVYSEGGAPYPHVDMLDMYRYLMRGDRLQKPPHCPALVYDIARGCWQKDPNKRPNFTSIVKSLELIMQLQEGYSDEELLTMADQPPPYADRQLLNAPATTAVTLTATTAATSTMETTSTSSLTTTTAATATTTPTSGTTSTGSVTVTIAKPTATAPIAAPSTTATPAPTMASAGSTTATTSQTTTEATGTTASTTGITAPNTITTITPQSASALTITTSTSTGASATVTSAPDSEPPSAPDSEPPSPDSDYFTPVDPFTKLSDLMAAHDQGTLDAQGSIELLYLTSSSGAQTPAVIQ